MNGRHRDYQKTVVLLLLERDGIACGVCADALDLDARPRTSRAATVDHLLSLDHPDYDRLANMRLVHHGCNAGRWLRDAWQKAGFRNLVIPKISAARRRYGSPALRGRPLTPEHRAAISATRNRKEVVA